MQVQASLRKIFLCDLLAGKKLAALWLGSVNAGIRRPDAFQAQVELQMARLKQATARCVGACPERSA